MRPRKWPYSSYNILRDDCKHLSVHQAGPEMVSRNQHLTLARRRADESVKALYRTMSGAYNAYGLADVAQW